MLTINFSPFPVLRTERLCLRQLTNKDETDMFRLRSNREVMKYIPRPLAQSIGDAAVVIQNIADGINNNNSITWGIFLNNSELLIGTIGFVRMTKEYYRAEVGYLLDTNCQGKGIMREALLAVIEYGFNELKLHSIEAVVSPDNLASIKLLEKTFFKKEGYFKQNQFYNKQFHDTVYYSLLKSEYLAKKL